MSQKGNPPYADFIVNLPKANLAVEGPVGHLLSSGQGQVVFFELPAGSSVPPHSHGAQWGVIIDGELNFTIGGETTLMGRGDAYYIPAGVEHSVEVISDCRAIDVFADPDRYQAK